MKLFFVRHGESQANILHEISNRGLVHGLTRRGREQALALVDQLQGCPITRLYSSPLLRAVETSVILAAWLDLDYEVVDALREYDCGILEGRSDEAAWQMWRELFDDWDAHRCWERRIESGESFHDIRARFVPFIERLIRQYGDTDDSLLCVSHGGLYRMMLPQVVRNINHELMSTHGFDYMTCVVVELTPAGLICVEWSGGSYKRAPFSFVL
jgi:broad specificity phosphatase PhoE